MYQSAIVQTQIMFILFVYRAMEFFNFTHWTNANWVLLHSAWNWKNTLWHRLKVQSIYSLIRFVIFYLMFLLFLFMVDLILVYNYGLLNLRFKNKIIIFHENINYKWTYFVIAQRSSVTLSRFLVIFLLTINSFSCSKSSKTNAPIMQYPTTKDSKPICDNKKLMIFRKTRQQLAHLVGGGLGAAEGGGPPARLSPPAPTIDAILALLISCGSNSLLVIESWLLGILV